LGRKQEKKRAKAPLLKCHRSYQKSRFNSSRYEKLVVFEREWKKINNLFLPSESTKKIILTNTHCLSLYWNFKGL